MHISSQDITSKVQGDFNFSVDKFPLSGPDGLSTPWYALFRSDTNEVVGNGSVTKRYVPHQTEDVLALVDAAGEAFDGKINCTTHFRDGHYVSIQPTDHERLKVYDDQDNVWPRILINAGYDGRAFQATLGYYRDLCRNLAMLETVGATGVSIRHTQSLRDKLDDLRETFATLRGGWVNLQRTIRRMEDQQVDVTEVMRSIYGDEPRDEGRSQPIHRKRSESIINRLIRERYATGRPRIDHREPTVSAWEMFNAIQGYSQHDTSRRGSPTAYDRMLLSNRDAYVRRAENLLVA